MIATLGEAEPLSVSIRPPLTVRHVLMPVACLDARTFVKGKFTRYHDAKQRAERPTLAGYVDLSDAPLQRGSLVELACQLGKPQCKPGKACLICHNKWRINRFQGDSAAMFYMYNRAKPARRRLDLDHIVKHSSFLRPLYSLDGIAQSQTAVGEPPEYHGKTLILDTRYDPPVARSLHLDESSRLMENPDSEPKTYMELNPEADLEELARFVGDGMSARFVEAVGSRTVRRIKQCKLAVAMRLVNSASTRTQALMRGVMSRGGQRVCAVTILTPDDTPTRGLGSAGTRSMRLNKNLGRLHANSHFQRARSTLADVLITSVREVFELSCVSAAVTLQAAVRGWKFRRFLPKIREAKAELNDAWL